MLSTPILKNRSEREYNNASTESFTYWGRHCNSHNLHSYGRRGKSSSNLWGNHNSRINLTRMEIER